MTRFCRSCLAFLLKIFSFLQTFVGISTLVYSLWLLNLWHRHGSPPDFERLPAPWFACASMGLGIFLCLIAFTGHIAAETISSCCLCFFSTLSSTLIMIEASLMCDLILNKHWEEDLPYDATGELKRLRAFIEENIDICKWIALGVITVQALSLLVAVVLGAMLPRRKVDYDSDEDFVVIRRPLLNPESGGAAFATNTFDNKGHQSDIWSSRIRQKYGFNPNEFTRTAVEP